MLGTGYTLMLRVVWQTVSGSTWGSVAVLRDDVVVPGAVWLCFGVRGSPKGGDAGLGEVC